MLQQAILNTLETNKKLFGKQKISTKKNTQGRKKNQMEILELKNTSDMKNPMYRINSRLDFGKHDR